MIAVTTNFSLQVYDWLDVSKKDIQDRLIVSGLGLRDIRKCHIKIGLKENLVNFFHIIHLYTIRIH